MEWKTKSEENEHCSVHTCEWILEEALEHEAFRVGCRNRTRTTSEQ